MQTKTQTLDNGMKVVVWSVPQLQTVGVVFGFNYGSIDDDIKVGGAAHYLEHMLFKGTKKRTWKQINEEARSRGMYHNAFTDKETTAYLVQAYKGYFKDAVDILADQVKNSVFPQKEFELERGPIINENLMRSDNPQFMFYDFMPMALYEKHPARMPVGGDEATIKRTAKKDVLKIYNNYYAPENMVAVVYGAVDAKKALDTIGSYFKDFEKEKRTLKRDVAREKQKRKEIEISRKGIKQTRLGIGFKCNGFKTGGVKEFLSMRVISEILTRRIYDEVREKRGLSYDPLASYSVYGTFGFIGATAGIEPVKLNEAKEVMLKEFEKLHDGEVKKEELDVRKKALSIKYSVNKEDTLLMADSIADSELTLGDACLMEKLPNLIKTVTLDDVRKRCQMFMDVDKYGMVVLKPERSGTKS